MNLRDYYRVYNLRPISALLVCLIFIIAGQSSISIDVTDIFDTLRTIGTWISNNLSVEGLISLPALMVGFLVALAIYNFEDTKQGLKIDAPTLISKVVGVNRVLLGIFLVSLLPISWPASNNSFTVYMLPLLVILYLVGLQQLVQSLLRTFKWAKSIETGKVGSFRATMRTQYLASLPDDEKRDAWEKIWQDHDGARALIDERQLIRLFISSVTQVDQKETVASWLLQDMISAVNAIHIDDPVILQELVTFCMNNAYGLTSTDTIEARNKNNELRYAMNTRRLLFKILEKTFERNDNSLFSFIEMTRTHIRNNGMDEALFIDVFAPNFFSLLKNRTDTYWIWETLPQDWRITSANLTSAETNRTTLAWLNAYSKWVHTHNLLTDSSDFDMTLDDATRAMLPSADTISWAKLFAFFWSSYGVETGESSEYAQVRNFAEHYPTFGLMSPVISGFFGDTTEQITNEAIAAQRTEVFEIAARTTIFPYTHNNDAMNTLFAAIEQLKRLYETSEENEKLNRILWLEYALEQIQNRINR